ncbi:MAG: hypothetical protein CVT89_09440, partial [Candidatus Altiarchaeales archaeon HGW-Altiarchaeales-2]
MYSTKEAMIIKEHQDAECDVFYIDMRAYGKDFEQYIERAKNMNIKYHRCLPSVEEMCNSKNLILTYETEDGKIEQEIFDMVVLAVGLCPPKDNKKIANVSGIELNKYGFCKTTETAPVEAGREGIYVCGAFSGPKDIEPLFRETLVESGLNQYLFEMANIRDHCSWVHSHEPVKATEKAKDLVKMAVAKVNLAVPLKITTSDVIRSALVIGGGVSGMTAALEIANQGFSVSLIERDSELGGNLKNVHYTLTDPDISKFLNNLIAQVTNNDLIKIYTNTEIKSVDGYVGDFTINTENSLGIFNLKKTTSFFNIINLNNTENLYDFQSLKNPQDFLNTNK